MSVFEFRDLGIVLAQGRSVLRPYDIFSVLRSCAAEDQELGDVAERVGFGAVGSEFGDGAVGEIFRDFVGALEAVDCGVGGFVLGDVFAGGLAESGGGFFDVEDVVGDLEGPADFFAEAAEARDVFGLCAGAECAGGDRGAD